MMEDINVVLEERRTKSVHIDIDAEGLRGLSNSLEASIKAELKTPKDKEDRSFLLLSTFRLKHASNPELFQASIVVEFFFESDMVIEEYDDIIQEKCFPIIKSTFETMISTILADMGYKNFLDGVSTKG